MRARHDRPGRPRRRAEQLHADKGYDYPRCRRYAKTHLGRRRWVVERTISWILRFKRLGPRYNRTEATLLPLLLLAITLIYLRRLRHAHEF